jgi:hypothetical protein
MAIEKSWLAVPVQLLSADGGRYGQLQVPSTKLIKVKQIIALASDATATSDGLNPKFFQVQAVTSATTLEVGPLKGQIKDRSDVSEFTIALHSLMFANKQERNAIPYPDIVRAIFEEEPTVAVRTFQVDYLGNEYSKSNPFPVQLSDGSINIETLNAELRVQLSAKDNDPTAGDVHSSIRIGGRPDGSGNVYEAAVNPDGSFNVVVENGSASRNTKNIVGDETVVPNLQSDVVTYTVPAGKTAILERVTASGQQIARFDLVLNSSPVDTQRSWYGNFNIQFEFGSTGAGYMLNSGDVLTLKVTQQQEAPGDFNGRIQVTESV